MSPEEVVPGERTTSEQHPNSSEPSPNNTESTANNSEPSPNIDLVPSQSETRAKPMQNHYDSRAVARAIRARTERNRAETDRKPSDLLKYARKNAPSEGDERETRCAWIVRDDDAPLGEWWIAKCCGAVLDSSAKVGGHRCTPRATRRARSAKPASSRSRWWQPW